MAQTAAASTTKKIIPSVDADPSIWQPRLPTLEAQLNCMKLNNRTDQFDADVHSAANIGREVDDWFRGDSPLTIDGSWYVGETDDQDDDGSSNEDDRALFSPTTDEDLIARERSQEKARQYKLSLGGVSSSSPSKLSSDEGSDGGELKSEKSGETGGEIKRASVVPYYSEPDWTFTPCDGIYYKAYKSTYLYPMYTPEVMAPVEAFQARDDDIVLCSSMKTGTTWLQSIILAILHSERDSNILTRGEAHQLSPCLERMADPTAADSRSGLQMIDDLPKDVPRFYQTHLPWRAMPPSIKSNKKLRMIYVTRNPKDTAVSWYYFLRHARERMGEDVVPHVSVQQFGRQMMGQTPQVFGPFKQHVDEFWALTKETQRTNILFLSYEQLQQRYVETVQEVAKFMGKNFPPATIIGIAKSCRLDSLKALEVNQRDSQICALHTTSFFRKGQTGNWKEHFTVAFNEEMDEWLKSEAKKTDFRFEFV